MRKIKLNYMMIYDYIILYHIISYYMILYVKID